MQDNLEIKTEKKKKNLRAFEIISLISELCLCNRFQFDLARSSVSIIARMRGILMKFLLFALIYALHMVYCVPNDISYNVCSDGLEGITESSAEILGLQLFTQSLVRFGMLC